MNKWALFKLRKNEAIQEYVKTVRVIKLRGKLLTYLVVRKLFALCYRILRRNIKHVKVMQRFAWLGKQIFKYVRTCIWNKTYGSKLTVKKRDCKRVEKLCTFTAMAMHMPV